MYGAVAALPAVDFSQMRRNTELLGSVSSQHQSNLPVRKLVPCDTYGLFTTRNQNGVYRVFLAAQVVSNNAKRRVSGLS